tara:strand:+ start:3608 stop:4636 length:1029 start_codon:yes stop_codon:yes gene_type:complete
MSRLRKAKRKINKYQGNYAEAFSKGISTDTPFAKMSDKIKKAKENALAMAEAAKAKAGATVANAQTSEENTKKQLAENGTSSAAQSNAGGGDVVPTETDYSREEVGAFFQRVKLAKEKEELEAMKDTEEEEAAEVAQKEAEQAEEDRENTSQGKDITFSDDYKDGMSGKERRGEKRDNRREIRAGKKAAKGVAKDEKKAKIAEAKKLKGKDKRQAKRAARKDYRKDKKSIRKAKRSNKKANRKANRKARKKRRRWSDIRVKENIIFVGYSNEGFKMYDFDYINKNHGEHRYRGLMAQDLIGLSLTDNYYSDLVTKEDGCYMVDYSLTDVEMEIVKINEKAKV